MKRIINKVYLFAFSFVLVFSACTNLEIEETDSLISDGFQGLANPSSSVDELYNRLNGQYGDQANLYALNEVTTDAALVPTRGTDWGDNGRWRNLHTHEWNAEAVDIVTPFNDWNANQLIASQILDSRSNPSDQNIGDASFVRAYSMWIILDLFGQVPFRDVTLPSSSIPEVLTGQAALDFILADLEQAISKLPSVSASSGEANGRASKAAAKFLKAKVLLNKFIYIDGTAESADMAQVVSLVDEIASEGYGLQAGYFDLFRNTADNETIWSLRSSTGNRIFNGLHYNSTALRGGGWNGFSTLAEYYDLFEGDANSNPVGGTQEERRGFVPTEGTAFTGEEGTSDNGGLEDGSNVGFGFLIGQQYDLDGTALKDRAGAPLTFKRNFQDGSGNNSLINNDETTGIRVIKYHPKYGGGDEPHEIVFRYADAHLMKAEALMRSGGDPTALVNELRAIRGATPFGTVSEQQLLDERGRELYAESWRRNDMIRFGQYTRDWEFKAANSIGNSTYELFPIPAAQLLANPNLVQNPGY
ncbi:RagB/SusD family nutrient uptake outer membrane protein [Flagellimonas pacifica]|uniref:Starch-binding associating with outer membrane n=1 Tax=Flagellimonas pacifica TaxID=1247520 RepID=A0A285MBN6_9FLAO|nr:RagB/SusD family nutrient uptake outer membrane protein [Allomuricauda parva]SNY94575.1 Starch-binding associating with outer membrane [Allomuricauda parva]